VRDGKRELSYGELATIADRAVTGLRQRGVSPGDLVAICAGRSVELVVAVIATLGLGAAVLPLHQRSGPARMRQALAAAAPRIVLADAAHRDLVPGAADLAELTTEATDGADERAPAGATSQSLAYVLQTSGSTGVPKAVMVPHSALANRLRWGQSTYPLSSDDTVLHLATPVFDFAFWEILAPLCHGATVLIAPEGIEAEPRSLARFLAEEKVTCAHFVPSLLAEFFEEAGDDALACLRYLFCGGEVLPVSLAARLSRLGTVRVFNQYGPAEATIDCTAWELPATGPVGTTVPIGEPITGCSAYVLDERLRLVADGDIGMLYVGGAGVAWGYLGDAARTAEAFLPDPFSEFSGARLYSTGDRVRRLPGGPLEFVGRVDEQIKIRGVRIEPGEVEQALAAHPAVELAAVIVTTEHGQSRLAAHFTPTGAIVSAAELREHLGELVPAAAVPQDIHAHRSLPRLPSGKIDRSALIGFQTTQVGIGGGDPGPRTPTEVELSGIWKKLLKTDTIRRDDDFFACGGHSLLAMRLMARMRAAFGVRLPARSVFGAPTLGQLAELIDRAKAEAV
jgi:amino acid adenylation domain-containing protein